MLLYNFGGATSYQDLCTINGEQQETFQDACIKLGLLDSDTEIDLVS